MKNDVTERFLLLPVINFRTLTIGVRDTTLSQTLLYDKMYNDYVPDRFVKK